MIGAGLLNAATLGLNFAGNIGTYFINKRAINSMQAPSKPLYVPLQAETLPTRISTSAEEAKLREDVAKQEGIVKKNLASGRSIVNATNAIRNQGIGLYNQLQDNKKNTELGLIIRDKLNRQGIYNQNRTNYTSLINDWRNRKTNFENQKIEATAENKVAAINNFTDAIAGEKGFFSNIESNRRFRINAFLEVIGNPYAIKALNSPEGRELARRFLTEADFKYLGIG